MAAARERTEMRWWSTEMQGRSTAARGRGRPSEADGGLRGCAEALMFAVVEVPLVVARLVGAIDWPWWAVLAPTWGTLLVFLLAAVVVGLAVASDDEEARWL